MEYLLKCECGLEHRITKSQAGQEIECSCGQKLTAPTLRGISKLPQAPLENQPAGTQTQDKASAWNGWRGPTMAAATAIMLISGGFSIRYLMQRSSIDTSYTMETQITLDSELIAKADPRQLDVAWNEFAGYTMSQKRPPNYFLWNRYAEERENLAKITGGIAAFFGLIATGIWFSAKRQ